MAVFRCVLAGVSLLALLASGCAKAKAETVVADGPALIVPPPPPRLVAAAEPLEAELPAEPPLPVVAAPPPPVAVTPPPTPAPVAAAPARPPARRPETETSPIEPTRSPRDLRPAPSAAGAAEEGKVTELIARAMKDLSRVNYRGLSPEGRAQYDQSKRFADQAESAVKDRNLPFAQTLADKAATLAAGLLSR